MGRKFFSVAIDGPSGAGKSTLARAAARELGFRYVDTGAIYRTVGLAAWREGLAPEEPEEIGGLLPRVRITVAYDGDGLQRMGLNGEDVTEAIRRPEVSLYTSRAAALPLVRSFLLDMQRETARQYSVVMDGRDIGTVVLPGADVKIYLTASEEARASRRFRELQERGTPQDYGVILEEVRRRDYNDTHRAAAPLRPAEGAVVVDTTELDFAGSLDRILAIVKGRIPL